MFGTIDTNSSKFDEYRDIAQEWEQMSLVDLDGSLTQWADWRKTRSAEDPTILLLPAAGGVYRGRLIVSGIRRSLRIAAFAAHEFEIKDRWPDRLIDVVPKEYHDEMVDPVTGSLFAYDVADGLPRLRSVAIREIGSRSMKQLRELTEESLDGGGRLTYFPATRRGR